MFKTVAMVAALMISTPALATPVDLWGKITSETTAAEIPTLVDSSRFRKLNSHRKDTDIIGYQLSESCEVHIEFRHKTGKVDQVMIEWLRQPNCVDAIRGSLTAKYGDAVTQENTQGYGINAAIAGRGRMMVWADSNRTIGLFTSNDGLLTQLSYKVNAFDDSEI